MKREQAEKIIRAAIALREAVGGARRMAVSTTGTDGKGIRFSIDTNTDADARAFAAALGTEAQRHDCGVAKTWFLLGFADLEPGIVVMISGPEHTGDPPAAAIDDASVDAAVAHVGDAIAAVQTSLLCYADTEDGPCVEANGHAGEHSGTATTADTLERQMRASVVFDAKTGERVKDRRGGARPIGGAS